MTWYYFIYSYIIWEFGHFIYHFLGHKVRFFWCFHATHHTPEEMNLSVSHAHFFLEGPYADVIRTTICIVLGVEPAMLFTIMFIDGTYGSFIHIGDNMIKSGKLGILNKIILTPSHHRVHHARNPQYIDTNYCNLSVCKTKHKKKLVILSAIDNLIKGGAGQAVQNMNIKFKFDISEGLK